QFIIMDKKYYAILIGSLLVLTMAVILVNPFGVTAGYPNIKTGRDTATSTGFAVNLDSLIIARDVSFMLRASATNTDPIGIAYSKVTAPVTSSDSFRLYPGESVGLDISNANVVWFAGTAGDGVEFITEVTY
ncbi:unnamed protein product, partial [marine sediment metagenome]